MPHGCDLEAAGRLSNYQVAYHLLHTASRGVEAGAVLVHTAAGGVGSAAVQLALIAGMRVVGVVGSEAKRQAVLALGTEHAINRETTAARWSSWFLDVSSAVRACTAAFTDLSFRCCDGWR